MHCTALQAFTYYCSWPCLTIPVDTRSHVAGPRLHMYMHMYILMLGGAVMLNQEPIGSQSLPNAALDITDITVHSGYFIECSAHRRLCVLLCTTVYHCVPSPPFTIVCLYLCLCLCLCFYLLFFSRRMNAVVGVGWRRDDPCPWRNPLAFSVMLMAEEGVGEGKEWERQTDGEEGTSPPPTPLHQCPLHHQTSANITSGPSTLLLLYCYCMESVSPAVEIAVREV